MKVRFHPVADAELMEAAQWYEDRSTGNGVRFISAAVDASFTLAKTRCNILRLRRFALDATSAVDFSKVSPIR